MSRKYKFRDNSKLYFVTFTVTNWIDLFIRTDYKDIVLASIRYCQQHKDLEVHAWCIMTSHLHPHLAQAYTYMQTYWPHLAQTYINWRRYAAKKRALAYLCQLIL